MDRSTLTALTLTAFAATAVGLWLFRRFGSHPRLLDVPNERSSHSTPVLRGGGIVLVSVCLGLYLLSVEIIGVPFSWGYLLGAAAVAGVSWLDDLYNLSAAARLPVHLAAAMMMMLAHGPVTAAYVPLYGELDVGGFGYALTLVWIVWVVNAYNFMDGIDGLAGIQAVAAGVSWAIFGYAAGTPVPFVLGILAASSALGFLIHNWSPAKVFLGDVGSAFLGFTFASLPLIASDSNTSSSSPLFAFAGLVFLWPFLFDTVFTFVKRAAKGERVWLAHRQHLYQWMVIGGASHRSVTLLYGITAAAVNAVFLFAATGPTLFEGVLLASLGISAASLLLAAKLKKV